ncbi:MAG: BamA/TamA family outer membrane protein, partial [Deltaproteobacteria bacterium]|nr:BamA/TamA family outer membrane protein [Deltaproteobacteria bacterium]
MRAVAQMVALVVLAQLGCSSIVAVPPGLPKKGRVVREVAIEKVEKSKKVPGEEVAAGLETHPPEGLVTIKYNVYDEDAAAADRLRIESFYQKQGFFSAKVKEVRIYPVRDRYMDVVFRVDEGQPTLIKMLSFAGLPDQSPEVEAKLFETIGIEIGDRYTEVRYLKAKQRVALALAESGYAFAELRGQVLVDKKAREAGMRFVINAGPKVTLGQGTVAGLDDFPAETVAKRIAWKPGDQYHPALIGDTRKDILALNMFASVRPDLDKRTGTTVFPKLVVSESKKNELRLGGGFAADPLQCRIRGRATYVRRGFLSPLNTLTIDARPAYAFGCLLAPNRNAEDSIKGFVGEVLAAIDRIDFPLDYFITRAQVGFQRDELEAFTTQGPRLNLETRRRFFSKRLLVKVGWGFNLDSFTEYRISDAEALRVEIPIDDPATEDVTEANTQRVGFYYQSVALDYRDQVLAPTRGFFGQVDFEQGGVFAAGEATYFRITPEVRGYYTLLYDRDEQGEQRARITLAGRVAGGSDLEGDSLPVTKRFFSGGASRHRGFPQRTLSPTANNDDGRPLAVGGSSMFETNLEIRTLVYDPWGVVVFADGGDTTNQITGVDLANLHWAVGG